MGLCGHLLRRTVSDAQKLMKCRIWEVLREATKENSVACAMFLRHLARENARMEFRRDPVVMADT